MRVKVPREFKIGATLACVSLKSQLSGDDGFKGTFNKRTGDLNIDDRLIGNSRDKTFAHEVNEVIKENYDMDTSERDLSCFAYGWLEFLSQMGIEFDWSDIENAEVQIKTIP